MLVDDEPDLVSITKTRLEASGYEVVTAQDGLDALEKVKIEKPDLILLDLLMPRMDGFEFIRQLRTQKDKSRNTPIIVISARVDLRDSFNSDQISAFIAKPYESSLLLSKVQEASLKGPDGYRFR